MKQFDNHTKPVSDCFGKGKLIDDIDGLGFQKEVFLRLSDGLDQTFGKLS